MTGNKAPIGLNKGVGQPGFTLMEILVSVTIFTIIIVSASDIFRLAINGQRQAIASQNVQESVKYFLEVTGKEIRMAKRNGTICADLPSGTIYALVDYGGAQALAFRNYYDQCVHYYLNANDGRLMVARSDNSGTLNDYISPAKIKISNLKFVIRPESASYQPLVTMNFHAKSAISDKFGADMDLQTTVASRYYKDNN